MSVPTPPIHAPAWVICRLSRCHELKMDIFWRGATNSMETCQRDSRSSLGKRERHRHTTEAGWRYAQLAAPGRRLAPASIHLTIALSSVEHLPSSTTAHQQPKRSSVSRKG